MGKGVVIVAELDPEILRHADMRALLASELVDLADIGAMMSEKTGTTYTRPVEQARKKVKHPLFPERIGKKDLWLRSEVDKFFRIEFTRGQHLSAHPLVREDPE